DLIPQLQKQGMNLVFDKENSNLTKVGKVKIPDFKTIFVSKVNQNVFVDVNEEGSEAAVVTSIEFGAAPTSSSPRNVLRFIADRSFFYIIRDNETKSNLFMGSIVNPEYK
ncbi:MAG: serpin family protein, partial [Cyanobacteriota bacterium]